MPPAGVKMPPRPMGYPMPPAGVKMPPRPMGYPMPPAGVKMPPRPMGYPMPPAPAAEPSYPPHPAAAPAAEPSYPPHPAAAPVSAPVPAPAPSADESDVDELWNNVPEPEPEVDENGFIDDLEPDKPEQPAESAEIEEEPAFEENPYEHNMASDLGLPPAFVKTKVLLPLFMFLLAFGGVAGYFAASVLQSGAENELPGVVTNAEIPKGRPRCGIAQKGQGCVLYLMNAQRREVEAKDFFSMASDILGVPKFQIETANIRYATMRIPPGYIALLNVPPM